VNHVGIVSRSLTLGFACGLRSMTGPAMLALNRGENECEACQPALLRWMRSDLGRRGLVAAALGEAILDKTPLVPARTTPGPLAGRVFCGGLSGFLLARASDRKGRASLAIAGAVAGGIGGFVGSFAGYHARRTATERLGLPDALVALVEDATAVAVARSVVGGQE
jgi:uncharacterized membrane protein